MYRKQNFIDILKYWYCIVVGRIRLQSNPDSAHLDILGPANPDSAPNLS
jgi:hypothetical protein